MLVNNTPLETHMVGGVPILVKREDLCAPYPGPMFSKMRGVYAHIQNRPESVIGVLDTLHSKAGWCVSYVGKALGKKVVNYWPRYKADPRDGLARQQQREAHSLGARMVSVPAGRSAILYHAAKKHLKELGAASGEEVYLMPNALKLPESITENAAEVVRTAQELYAGTSSPVLPEEGTLIVSISSGTVAAGVLKGFAEVERFENYNVILHMGYSRSASACREYISAQSGLDLGSRVSFVDEGYGYADAVPEAWCNEHIPFPANPHYDAKAWKWMHANIDDLASMGKPIVFWNIGA